MRLEITADQLLQLRNPENFMELSLAAPSELTPQSLDSLLQFHAWGRGAEDNHVWLREERLREAVDSELGEAVPDWQTKYLDMLSFARTRGWVSEDGSEILVHRIEA